MNRYYDPNSEPIPYPEETPTMPQPENRIENTTTIAGIDRLEPAAGGWTPPKWQRVVAAFVIGCGTGAGTVITASAAAAAQANPTAGFTMPALNAGLILGGCIVGGFSAAGYELGMRSAGTRKL